MQVALNFTAFITFNVPFANNTQRFFVTQDDTFQYWHAYNFSGAVADYTLVTKETGYYVRTEKDHYACLEVENSRTSFVPDLAKFTDMGDVFLDQRRVRHYRLTEEFSYQTEGQDYNAVQDLQQEFYCVPNETLCTPVRWELRSRSNFDSHQDVYILDYDEFRIGADYTYADPDPLCPIDRQFAQKTTVVHMMNDVLNVQDRVAAAEQILKKIRSRKGRTFTVGHNKFSRFSLSQRRALTSKRLYKDTIERPIFALCPQQDREVPNSLDWRIRGYSTPVKDQIACGSCWTFSTAGSIEGRVNILRQQGDLVRVSEQSILDCFWDQDDKDPFLWSQGCEGGQHDYALKWFADKKLGFALEKDYPYFGQNDWCKEDLFTYADFKVDRVCQVPMNDVAQMKYALQDGPVAIAVGVSDAFVFYTGGVFNDPDCGKTFEELGHAVLLVGYGVDEKFGEYWIVKNSWSNFWGQDGYIYISTKDNTCGVLTDAAYPVVTKSQ